MRFFLKTLVIGLVLLASARVTQAGVLVGYWTSGALNTLEDGSREVFVDLVDSDANPLTTSIDPGDVLLGFSKITGIEPFDSGAGPDFTPNSVYAIFSQTFDTISAPIGAVSPSLLRTFTFRPTTVAGLTLADLLGPLDITPAGSISAGMVAIVSAAGPPSAFSVDITNTSPGDRNGGGIDFSDYLDVLQDEGELEFVFGKLAGNYFSGATDITTLTDGTGATPDEDFIKNLSLAPTGQNLVVFSARLSNLFERDPPFSGTTSAAVIGGNARIPTASENPDGIFAFVDDADIQFRSNVVPEPASFAVWGALASIMGLCYRRRRR